MSYLKRRDHKLIFSFHSLFLHRQKQKAVKAFILKKLMLNYAHREDFEKIPQKSEYV